MNTVTTQNFKLGMLEVYVESGQAAFLDGVKYNSTGLANILNKNLPLMASFKAKQKELVDKFCAFDPDGNVIIQDGQYVFDEQEDKKLFLEQLEKLLNEQVELIL